jgi:Dyp-type peroxidase family
MMTPSKLPLDEIQGVVLHGYGHLWEARFVLLSVEAGRAADARRFLADLELTSATRAAGRAAEPGPFVNVAFTHRGLAALGLPPALLDDFPRDFVEGPTTDLRARLLGDTGESSPSTWTWGNALAEPIHVMLLLYASEGIDALHRDYASKAAAAGLREARSLDTIRLPRRQEHFGFRDGISQPTVSGADGPSRPFNEVEPGEIFLGQQNAFGEPAHVPGGAEGFAANGSYLVARQLEQRVRAFWAFCRAAASTDDGAIAVASRMVGRWPSGAPLVEHPGSDAPNLTDRDRNAFEYGAADPDGMKCPFGAHIRRTNPRDWGVARSIKESRTVVARHRMIRRGRAYGRPLCDDAEPASYLKALNAPGPDADRGLHFLCFNASIEQQFEFVQRQWADNPKFAGAVNGADPLIGSHEVLAGEPPTFSVQGTPTAQRIPLDQRFVRTRGSAYFFMPTLRAVRSLREP